MFDLFYRALVSSDLVISAQRQNQRQKKLHKQSLPTAALALLKVPTVEVEPTPKTASEKCDDIDMEHLDAQTVVLTVEMEK